MTDRLVTIARYSTPFEANMAKSMLESAGIPAFVADEYTIGINWLYSNALGGVKLQVPESFASEALDLLSFEDDHAAGNQIADDYTCPRCGSGNIEVLSDKRGSFLTWVLLGLPALLSTKKKKCRDCGFRWRPH
jgi:predicted RNA-binding Zn-ribbon protein involved in translation (DUF1610 family)